MKFQLKLLYKKNINVSYAIPVCNEFVEIQRLITFLLKNKRDEDEIVVLFDSNNGDKEVETYLRKMNVEKTLFRWASYKFEGDFAAMKNRLNSMCVVVIIYSRSTLMKCLMNI